MVSDGRPRLLLVSKTATFRRAESGGRHSVEASISPFASGGRQARFIGGVPRDLDGVLTFSPSAYRAPFRVMVLAILALLGYPTLGGR